MAIDSLRYWSFVAVCQLEAMVPTESDEICHPSNHKRGSSSSKIDPSTPVRGWYYWDHGKHRHVRGPNKSIKIHALMKLLDLLEPRGINTASHHLFFCRCEWAQQNSAFFVASHNKGNLRHSKLLFGLVQNLSITWGL